MNHVLRFAMAGLLSLGLFGLVGSAHATVVIGGTRVVYPSQDKEVTIKLQNQGSSPALVQVWLDAGDEKSTPESANVPFTLIPPLFRLDPSKGQAVRVMYTGEPLPKDKESLFWVNVLEVPPKAKATEGDDGNKLQFAFRTRIKMFFRPAGLPGDVAKAADQLTWKLVAGEGGKGVAVQASNPTPYYVNFARVGLKVGEKSIMGDGGMVAPGGSTTFPVKELTHRPSGDVQAQFITISDYGAHNTMVKPFTP